MYYAALKPCDVANGPGVRVSLFVSGCTHHCKGCFNPEAWSFSYGQLYDETVTDRILQLLAPDHIRGLSLLGGEPFEPENQGTLVGLCRQVRQKYPHKTIWCYTGYHLEEDILSGRLGRNAQDLLRELDILVDGEFVEELKDLRLRFRGSSNQRILNIPATLQAGNPVLWDGDMYL